MASVKMEADKATSSSSSKQELKPGQKHPTPTPGFGDRVFYETLLRQRPDSEMAQEWCVNYGVLPYEEAERLFVMVSKRKRKGGAAAMVSPSRSSSATKKKKKKAKVVHDDADMHVSSSGAEGIGTAVL